MPAHCVREMLNRRAATQQVGASFLRGDTVHRALPLDHANSTHIAPDALRIEKAQIVQIALLHTLETSRFRVVSHFRLDTLCSWFSPFANP
jgi:hypothetical protein